ncbi:MAG: hypothetical protein AAF632_15690 [Bacteroidota bacterium]
MNWKSIKDSIYFEDGSLRDIVISDWSIEAWEKWVDLVNRKYKLEFYNGQTEESTDKIDFQIINQYWKGKSDLVNTATIHLDQVIIKCYFFDSREFENDIQPQEFRSIANHFRLINYLVDTSNLSGKTVFLTGENSTDEVLLEVSGKQVKYFA